MISIGIHGMIRKRISGCAPMPQMSYVINQNNNPFGFYKYKMLQEELAKQFNRWYKNYKGGGKPSVCWV